MLVNFGRQFFCKLIFLTQLLFISIAFYLCLWLCQLNFPKLFYSFDLNHIFFFFNKFKTIFILFGCFLVNNNLSCRLDSTVWFAPSSTTCAHCHPSTTSTKSGTTFSDRKKIKESGSLEKASNTIRWQFLISINYVNTVCLRPATKFSCQLQPRSEYLHSWH